MTLQKDEKPFWCGMSSHRIRRICRRLMVAAVSLATCWLLAWGAAMMLIVNAPLSQSDVIVILSGSSVYRERAQWAAQLYRSGRTGKIILTNDAQRSGWSNLQQRNPLFYERSLDELHNSGVPRESVEVLSQPVSSTFEEAELLRDYAQQHGLRSMLVVTSAYHSRRALWTLRKSLASSGVSIGLSSVPTGAQTPGPWVWWSSVRGWQMVPTEYLKLVYYYFRFSGNKGK